MALTKKEDLTPEEIEANAKAEADKVAQEQEAKKKKDEEAAAKEAARVLEEQEKLRKDREKKDEEAAAARKKEEAEQEEAAKAERDRLADLEQKRLDEEDEARKEAGRKPKELKLVAVENLTHSDMRQYSSGLWIMAKSTANLLDDGWLRNQVAARLLKLI